MCRPLIIGLDMGTNRLKMSMAHINICLSKGLMMSLADNVFNKRVSASLWFIKARYVTCRRDNFVFSTIVSIISGCRGLLEGVDSICMVSCSMLSALCVWSRVASRSWLFSEMIVCITLFIRLFLECLRLLFFIDSKHKTFVK